MSRRRHGSGVVVWVSHVGAAPPVWRLMAVIERALWERMGRLNAGDPRGQVLRQTLHQNGWETAFSFLRVYFMGGGMQQALQAIDDGET